MTIDDNEYVHLDRTADERVVQVIGLAPDFDDLSSHAWEIRRIYAHLADQPGRGVCLGSAAMWSTAGGGGIFNCFSRLSADSPGAVTCQTSP